MTYDAKIPAIPIFRMAKVYAALKGLPFTKLKDQKLAIELYYVYCNWVN